MWDTPAESPAEPGYRGSEAGAVTDSAQYPDDIESRRIANEHVNVVAGVADRHQLGAELGGLEIKHAREPLVGSALKQGMAAMGRPDDVREQHSLGVAESNEHAACW